MQETCITNLRGHERYREIFSHYQKFCDPPQLIVKPTQISVHSKPSWPRSAMQCDWRSWMEGLIIFGERWNEKERLQMQTSLLTLSWSVHQTIAASFSNPPSLPSLEDCLIKLAVKTLSHLYLINLDPGAISNTLSWVGIQLPACAIPSTRVQFLPYKRK